MIHKDYYLVSMVSNAFHNIGLGIPLFVKVPRPGDSKGAFSVFRVTKLLAYLHTISFCWCQAGKLWIPTFKVFWSDSAKESNPGSTDYWGYCCNHY